RSRTETAPHPRFLNAFSGDSKRRLTPLGQSGGTQDERIQLMMRSSRAALTAAGALAIAATGAGAGAGLYAAFSPTKTKTVVSSTTTLDHSEPVSSSVSGL